MELYKLYCSAVYNSAYRIVGNSFEAEEIMQDSFLKLFEKIERYAHEPQKIEFILRRIAINGAIDVVRRRKNIIESVDTLPDKLLDSSPPPNNEHEEVDLEIEANLEQVHNAIEALPAGYKTVVVLKLIEEISNEEIAKMLSISQATVRSQFLRARKKIVEIINNM